MAKPPLADRPPIDAATPLDSRSIATASPALSSAAVTNNAVKRWDAKSPQGRRCRDLFKSLMRLVGSPPEPARQALCISAAELMVLAEVSREASLKQTTAKHIEAAFKAEKAMRHALAALGVDKPPSADEADDYGLFVDDDED
jgi:hypothetical protein